MGSQRFRPHRLASIDFLQERNAELGLYRDMGIEFLAHIPSLSI